MLYHILQYQEKKIFFTIYNLISIHSHNQYSLNFSRLLYPIVEILDPTLIEEIVGGYFFIKNSIPVNWEIYKDYLGDALTLVFFTLHNMVRTNILTYPHMRSHIYLC